jgi:hypothetical protein
VSGFRLGLNPPMVGLVAGDPVLTSRASNYELHPMWSAVVP